jgi:dTDP-4-amino-4,6-dideoxygalactose transaminase
VSASSGTAALVGAILGCAGRATTERPIALVPAFTFVGTAAAVEQCGYRVHLVDVDSEDWILHPARLDRHPLMPRVGLVVPVACYGRGVPQRPWQQFSADTGIPVVIDGAAAFEAIDVDRDTLLGRVPVSLSFHATKSFACGEGGCVITADPELARAITRALNFGFYDDRESRGASTNGKLSEYHAAVALAELDGWMTKQESWATVAGHYRDEARAAGLADRLVVSPDVAGCYVLFRAVDPAEADSIGHTLRDRRIGYRAWYGSGLHRHPHFRGTSRDELPVTDALAPCLLGLPVAPDLGRTMAKHVVAVLAHGLSRTA